jgi:hypothetical protein
MRPWMIGAVLSLGALATCASLPTAADGDKESPWLNDYAAAKAVAARGNKPMLVVFR